MKMSINTERSKLCNLMFEKEEKIAFGLLIAVISVIGATVFILNLVGTDSLATPYSPTIAEGTLVKYEGHIEKITETKSGDHMILTLRGVQVYLPAGDTILNVGDIISVIGTVQNYKGKREILVKQFSDVKIL